MNLNTNKPKRIVTINLTRTYFKTTSIEVEVDDSLTGETLQNFLATDEVIYNKLEEALYESSLEIGDDEFYISDHTNKSVYFYQDKVETLVKGLNREELEVFAFDNDVDLSDEESMGNFIGSLDMKDAKAIIKQLEIKTN